MMPRPSPRQAAAEERARRLPSFHTKKPEATSSEKPRFVLKKWALLFRPHCSLCKVCECQAEDRHPPITITGALNVGRMLSYFKLSSFIFPSFSPALITLIISDVVLYFWRHVLGMPV
jgi:hypothetical protein